tara:strand:- start:724 stop:1635 length:912 start_codon:yes stop_codon:yes gene_type:complete
MILYVLGNVAKDSFYYLENFPRTGETIISGNTIKDIGGKGFNQLIAASRLGVEVSFWTYTGSDETSEKIFEILDSEEISTENIFKQNNHSDESIIFINNEGKNYIVSNCINVLGIDMDYVKNMISTMKKEDVLLLQGNLKKEVTLFCVTEAFRKKIKIFLNASPICFDYKEIFPFVETLIINEIENKKLSDSDSTEIGNKILLDFGISNVITTQGEKGLLYSSSKDDFFFESPKKNVVDTTGAGDIFCGILTASICLGKNYKESCLNAMNIASLSVNRYGTYKSIPSKKEVFLNLNFNNKEES